MMQTEKEVVNSPAGNRSTGSLVKWIFVLVLIALLATVVNRGINERIKAASIVKQETADLAMPVVAVIHPRLENRSRNWSCREICRRLPLLRFTLEPAAI